LNIEFSVNRIWPQNFEIVLGFILRLNDRRETVETEEHEKRIAELEARQGKG